MNFDPVIEAYAEGAFVAMTPLLEFQFPDGWQRLWLGMGKLRAGGHDWLGIGRAISMDGLEQAASLEAADMTFTLSGADETMRPLFPLAASGDREAYVGSLVIVYMQFMTPDFVTVGEPEALRAGICGTMELSNTWSEDEGRRRTIMLPATNIFFGRGVAPNSFWSDRDQQLRHPGDLGLSELTGSQTFTFPQPWR